MAARPSADGGGWNRQPLAGSGLVWPGEKRGGRDVHLEEEGRKRANGRRKDWRKKEERKREEGSVVISCGRKRGKLGEIAKMANH